MLLALWHSTFTANGTLEVVLLQPIVLDTMYQWQLPIWLDMLLQPGQWPIFSPVILHSCFHRCGTQVVESGYLSSNMLPEDASFPRVPEAAQVFLSPLSPLAGRVGTPMSSTLCYQLSTPTHHQHFLPSSPIKSCQMAMIWMAITDSAPLVVKPSPTVAQKTVPMFGHFVMFGL